MESLYIHHISARPDFRAKGVGNALMRTVRELASAKGVTTMALNVWSFNTNAQRCFERRGFVDYSERMWLSPDNE